MTIAITAMTTSTSTSVMPRRARSGDLGVISGTLSRRSRLVVFPDAIEYFAGRCGTSTMNPMSGA